MKAAVVRHFTQPLSIEDVPKPERAPARSSSESRPAASATRTFTPRTATGRGAGISGCRSFAGQLNGLTEVSCPAHGECHWPRVASSALASILRALFPTTPAANRFAIRELERRCRAGPDGPVRSPRLHRQDARTQRARPALLRVVHRSCPRGRDLEALRWNPLSRRLRARRRAGNRRREAPSAAARRGPAMCSVRVERGA
jgi:hypothetical protein